jgi:hypothetical protein
MLRYVGKIKGALGLGFAAALALTAPTKADIVANLGTLTAPETGLANCLTGICFSSGTEFGGLPVAGGFTHQIHFSTDSINAQVIGGTLITPHDSITVTSIRLFQYIAGPTTVGAVDAIGALIATATLESAGPPTAHWEFTFFPLLPEPASYFVEFIGSVIGPAPSYQQSVSVSAPSAVPLPPALFLLAAAVCGLVGYARIRHKNVGV